MRPAQTERTVLGLFEEISQAAEALRRLKEARTQEASPLDEASHLMVLSSVPFPEGVLEADRSAVRLPVITLAFALVGIALGILTAGGSAALYVLRTGGKPILPGPPIGIIAYEFMMLAALSAAFFTALFEMRLPDWRAKVYDPRISEGLIGIAAHCETPEQIVEAENILRNAGAADIRRDARRF